MAKQRDNVSGSGGAPPGWEWVEADKALMRMERRRLVKQAVEAGAKRALKDAGADKIMGDKMPSRETAKKNEARIEAAIKKMLDKRSANEKDVQERIDADTKRSRARAKANAQESDARIRSKRKAKDG